MGKSVTPQAQRQLYPTWWLGLLTDRKKIPVATISSAMVMGKMISRSGWLIDQNRSLMRRYLWLGLIWCRQGFVLTGKQWYFVCLIGCCRVGLKRDGDKCHVLWRRNKPEISTSWIVDRRCRLGLETMLADNVCRALLVAFSPMS